MQKGIHLREWAVTGDQVRLLYEDETEVFIRKSDFDRAFGCIVSGKKEDIFRDFAIRQ